MTERLFSYGTLQQENVQLATFGRLLAHFAQPAGDGGLGQALAVEQPLTSAQSSTRYTPHLPRCRLPPWPEGAIETWELFRFRPVWSVQSSAGGDRRKLLSPRAKASTKCHARPRTHL